MRGFFRSVLNFIVIIVILASLQFTYKYFEKEIQNQIYIGFTDSKEDTLQVKDIEKLKADTLKDYQSNYSKYNSYVYYQLLSDSEKLIYKAYEYAQDTGKHIIMFDDRLLENCNYEHMEILRFYSIDSAIVEQNLATSESGFEMTHMVHKIFAHKTRGSYVKVLTFQSDRMEKKKEAIAEAEKIIANMPEGLSQTKKAEYFYDYLSKNLTYKKLSEEERKEAVFLYDALCKKVTLCDGFANAFSLLCNMSEIKCYEKVYFPEGEGSGHTWNTFFADGVWMNADATNGCADAELNADEINEARRWFGFSDTRQKHIPLYSDKLQKCETDLLPLACDFEKGTSKSVMAQSVKKAFENTDKNYILVKFPEPKISKDVLISFANALMHKIGSSHVESQDEGLYVLIYKIK